MAKKKIDPVLKSVSRALEDATYIPEAAYMQANGGIILSRHHAILPLGGYSALQNMRWKRPGLKQRNGCTVLHTTNDSTNECVNLGVFSKGQKSEIHFYSQWSDGDVHEATANPPGVTAGAFGSEVYSTTTTNMVPASFSTINDRLLYSDGTGYPYIYSGSAEYVKKFVVVYSAAAHPVIITDKGKDYTIQVTDGDASTYAEIDSLGDYSTDYDAIYICTDIPADAFTFTMGNVNTTESALTCYYWKDAWTEVSGGSDGTSASSCAFGKTGTFTFTATTDHLPHFMFGTAGYWYRFNLTSGDIDADTTITSVTFESNLAVIQNVWDGFPISCPESFLYIAADTDYEFYEGTAISIGGMTSSDKLYVGFPTPVVGIYIDVDAIPNTVAATLTVKYNANGSWTDTSATDGTTNDSQTMAKNGWVTWARPTAGAEQPMLFQSSVLYQYWYELTVSATLTTDVVIWVRGMPRYDMNELGVCQCSTSWRSRAVYAFKSTPGYIAISSLNNPTCLNGVGFAFQEIGDGRENIITAMHKFHSELMVWQQERGVDGGTVTLIQGHDPETYGRYLISDRYGTFSQKSVVVIEGVPLPTIFSGESESGDASFAFFISRYGIVASDGRKCKLISGSISPYFDVRETSTCIRRGYETQHWIGYDSSCHVLRIGLVTGTSATVPNTFLVYDLASGSWGHDVLAQELACHIEIEAGSGNAPVVQCGGGVDDGFVYLLNYGTNDYGTAITSNVKLELDAMGYPLHAREMFVRTGTFAATSLRSATYAWTVSTATGSSGEYFCRLAALTDPSLTDPVELHINGTPAPRGILGSLNPGEFAYGDNDTLGYSTVYVRLSDSSDPDSAAAGYVATVATGITMTPYINGNAQTARHLSIAPEIASETLRRNRFDVNTEGEHIGIKLENTVLDQTFEILDYGLELFVYRNQ